MDTLIYILKSTAILSLFYIVYFTVLRKDTFFSANRNFLIGGIIASFTLPFLIFTNTVYIDPPISNMEFSTIPVSAIETINPTNSFIIDWWEIGLFMYLAGVLFMVFRFIKQLFSLYALLRKQPITKKNGFSYIKVTNTITPFSFFRFIVYNPVLHSETDLKMILRHEQTHASQLHSIDVLLSNLILIFQWINPFAWLYKKCIEENLEFIADSETVVNVPSKKEYQLSMLKEFTSNNLQPILANNFYQSLIKKRIIMLQKNQSSAKKQWKLLLILPLLGFFLWSFNVEEIVKYNDVSTNESPIEHSMELPSNDMEFTKPIILSEKKNYSNSTSSSKNESKINNEFITKNNDSKIDVTVDKNTSDAELEKLKTLFKSNYNVTLKFSGVKRNSSGEIIKIKVSMKSDNSNASFNLDDTDGIQEFVISYDSKSGSMSIGNNNNHDMHIVSKGSNGFVYEIHEDEHGKGKTWVSKDGHKIKKGKHEYIIHDKDGGENKEIHIISGSGKNSNVWISKDGNVKKGEHTMIIDIDKDEDGEGNIFYFNSDENEDEDSIFIHKKDDNGFFFVGNDGKDPLVYINGEKSSKKEMEELGSEAIETIEVLKGDKATKKYGEDAKDGVILITTKKD